MKTIKKVMQQMCAKFAATQAQLYTNCLQKELALKGRLQNESGQGTVEYAILVGVLAVIAMIAIVAFKDKLGQLWEAIQSGVNGL